MEKDLKAQNLPALTAIYVGTALLVAFIHWSVAEVFTVSLQVGEQVLVVAAITSFGAVLSNVLPNSLKHPLVYFRYRNVLSGHRCRQICESDPRLFPADLERRWPQLFLHEMEGSEQNAYWYREIYRAVRNEPEVVQAHRSFLLFRDAAAGLFVLLLGLLVWNLGARIAPILPLSSWSLVILSGLLFLICQAARQSGDRMVANAVAVAVKL